MNNYLLHLLCTQSVLHTVGGNLLDQQPYCVRTPNTYWLYWWRHL